MNNSYLSHHGIKGMKWGVRRYQNPDGSLTPAGEKRYYKHLSDGSGFSINEKRRGSKGSGTYDITNKGHKVGTMMVDDEGKHRHIDWIGVNSKERGHGYGQKALDLIIEDGRKAGMKYITLDAAGLDPAARHIYEKKGFEAINKIDSDIWDDLVQMRLTL